MRKNAAAQPAAVIAMTISAVNVAPPNFSELTTHTPTLAETARPPLRPHPSNAPLSQNSREPSTIEPLTTQEQW